MSSEYPLQTNNKDTHDTEDHRTREDEEEILEQSLRLFDFQTPLLDKKEGVLRIFYNNINGLEINALIGEYIKQQKSPVAGETAM